MKVKILKDTVHGGGKHVKKGDTHDVSESDARILIAYGLAEPHDGGKKAETGKDDGKK